MGLSDSPFSGSVLVSSGSGSGFVSSVDNGEPQNLPAKEEDLYGADLHRVNNKAFLGGEEGEDAKTLGSSS